MRTKLKPIVKKTIVIELEEQQTKLIGALDTVLEEIKKIINSGRLNEEVGSNRNRSGFARLA